MDTADRSQFLQILHSRRDAIAERWHKAIVWNGIVPFSRREVRQRLAELTEQVIKLLLAEPFEPGRAESVGASLARLHYVQPETLGKTQEILARGLLEGVPADQAATLQSRLTALLGWMAAGFFRQARETILAEHEQIYRALITEHERWEQVLHDSEARYRVISELISNFAYALGVEPDGTIVYEWVTDSFADLTGFTPDEVTARGGWPSVVHPDDRSIASEHLQMLISGQPDIREFRIVAKGGRVRWVRDYGRPIRDEQGGRVVRIIGAAQDITESRQMEQYLLRTERLAAVGRVAAALAHELNNPLQAIRSNLELVLDFEPEPGARKEYLEVVRQEVECLAEVTQRVLDFAQPPNDTRYSISMASLVQRALALVGQQLRQARVEVTTDLPPDLPRVYGAPNQIVQVLLNLIINAIEAMPDGGHLQVAARTDGERLALSLTNDGPPVPPEYVGYIFDAFFSTKPGGTGLGLAISDSIVRKHGGTISVKNLSDGRGVKFSMTLPTSHTVRRREVVS